MACIHLSKCTQISHEDVRPSVELDEANRQFLAWLRAADVPLLPHRLSFYDALPAKSRTRRMNKNPNLNVGAFGRLDIGILVDAMRDDFLSRGLDTERVLYTDTDVLFAADIDYTNLASIPLPTFAAGTEVFSPALNTGVMLINATAWAHHYNGLIAYGKRKNFRFLSYDQTWVHEYFSRVAANAGTAASWTRLRDEVYNARGFMHPARPTTRKAGLLLPRVWHWHGFKPHDVECWHSAISTGRWPLRAWRDAVPSCTGKTRPRCHFMPVHGSGCRYFGRLTAVLGMTPCYLRTYTYLLMQHRRMLRVAQAILSDEKTSFDRRSECEERKAARRIRWDHEWKRVAARVRTRQH